MRKKIFPCLLIGCIFFSCQCAGQLSVFYTTGSDVIGWAVGKSNAGCERDDRARADFYNKGGDNSKGLFVGWSSGGGICLNEEYGCYTLVKGKSSEGETVFGYAGGFKTPDEALENAKRFARLHVPSAEENTIQVITSGCIAAPPPQNQSSNSSPQWSDWISGDCFKKISYRYMGKELVNLNYQYHYYFQATNDYSETIYFIMSLKDAEGKERFGTRYSIKPGQTIEFVEKMDKNYIRSFAIEKVCFKIDDGKYVACDDERQNNSTTSTKNKASSATINRAEIEKDAKKAGDLYCRLQKLEGMQVDLYINHKKDENLDKEIQALSKEVDTYFNNMQEKYNETKNKEASDLYKQFWGNEYDKCPYKQGG